MFEVDRIYCSDITGLGVRPFPDLVFEVDRILHLQHGIKISMDGRGHWMDNIFIERLWSQIRGHIAESV